MKSEQEQIDRRIRTFYGAEFDEADRLVGRSAQGTLEFERTQQFVRDRVPAGSRVVDVGGGTGVHAQALAARGDVIELIDPVPEHVQAASDRGLSAQIGDARHLEFPDHDFDAALLLGPLYHLVDHADRLRALQEVIRVVRPGGWVFAAGISRLATTAFVTVIGPAMRFDADGSMPQRVPYPDAWQRLVEEGRGGITATGFPGGHFHLAEELAAEACQAGLTGVEVHDLEGPAGQALEVSGTHDPTLVAAGRALAEAYGTQPGLRDLSPHLLALGRTPG